VSKRFEPDRIEAERIEAEIGRTKPGSEMPVVLTSGYSHVLAQHGTYGFELLHKPYSVEQLSRILRKVAKRHGRNRIHG